MAVKMGTKMNTIQLLILAGILVTIGDFALASWAREKQNFFILLGMGLNLFGIFIYAQTLNSESIGIATGIFLGFNILAVTLGGIFFFNEHISLERALGLLTLVGSIVFIEVIR